MLYGRAIKRAAGREEREREKEKDIEQCWPKAEAIKGIKNEGNAASCQLPSNLVGIASGQSVGGERGGGTSYIQLKCVKSTKTETDTRAT